jgi:hypothetical protein
MSNVTCTSCGWVHFARTRADVEREVAEFNVFYESSSDEVRAMYGRMARVSDQESCFCCGRREFREFVEGDCPIGCTLQGVIV